MYDKLFFAWGKFHPPHNGHKKIIDIVRELALAEHANTALFTSPAIEMTKQEKQAMLHDSFEIRVHVKDKFSDVFDYITKTGYHEATLVIGQDRHTDFQRMMKSYADHAPVPIKTHVVMGGLRRDSDCIEGLSSTKMRQFVKDGDKASFIKNSPLSYGHAINLYTRLKFMQG